MAIGEAAGLKLGRGTRGAFESALKELGSESLNVVSVDKTIPAMVENADPVYMRCGRIELPEFDNNDSPFKLDKKKYGLTAEAIVAAVKKVRGR